MTLISHYSFSRSESLEISMVSYSRALRADNGIFSDAVANFSMRFVVPENFHSLLNHANCAWRKLNRYKKVGRRNVALRQRRIPYYFRSCSLRRKDKPSTFPGNSYCSFLCTIFSVLKFLLFRIIGPFISRMIGAFIFRISGLFILKIIYFFILFVSKFIRCRGSSYIRA